MNRLRRVHPKLSLFLFLTDGVAKTPRHCEFVTFVPKEKIQNDVTLPSVMQTTKPVLALGVLEPDCEFGTDE